MTTHNKLHDCGISRRDLMRLGAGGLGFSLVGGIGPVPYVLGKANEVAAPATDSGKILVVFEWFGGNDGLNTIVPYGDAMYYKHRPTIGIKEKNLLKIDAQFGWQRSMTGMKQLYDEGKVAIIQGDAAGDLDRGDDDLAVARGRQVVRPDDRRGEGIGAADGHGAAAFRPEQPVDDGEAGKRMERVAGLVGAEQRDGALDIGGGDRGIGLEEAGGIGAAHGEQAVRVIQRLRHRRKRRGRIASQPRQENGHAPASSR